MLRLSKLTDYAAVVMVRLADAPAMQTSPGIAAATGIPEPTVAKVLKILSGSGLVSSQRGARGGYRLHRPLDDIPIAEVIAAIDGPVALTSCVEGATIDCECHAMCAMRGRWDPLNRAILNALNSVTLGDMKMAGIPPAFRVPNRDRPGSDPTRPDLTRLDPTNGAAALPAAE